MAKRAERVPRKRDEEKKTTEQKPSFDESADIKPITPGTKRFNFTPRTDVAGEGDREKPRRFEKREDTSFDKNEDFKRPVERERTQRKDLRKSSDKPAPRKPISRDFEEKGQAERPAKREYKRKEESEDTPKRPRIGRKSDFGFADKREKPSRFDKDSGSTERPIKERSDFKSSPRKSDGDSYGKGKDDTFKPRGRKDGEGNFERSGSSDFKPRGRKDGDGNSERSGSSDFKPRGRKTDDSSSSFKRGGFKSQDDKPFKRGVGSREDSGPKKPKIDGDSEWMSEVPASWKEKRPYKKKVKAPTLEEKDGKIRLNKYIANAGICSRREADELIASGAVKVNGKIVTELGTRISPEDKIQYGDETLSKEVKRYLLLNKPKDYITTANDPEGRKTVMELILKACKERLYPVGRLDRATTGLLLFTNDGELARKLTHPSHEVKKVYHVTLSKNLKPVDMKRVMEGLELEDGRAEVDDINYVGEGGEKNEIGIELHSGKNRIVRRIFEHLGYEVVKLDRTLFGGLTKKDLPRGKFRFLTEKEVVMLKMS